MNRGSLCIFSIYSVRGVRRPRRKLYVYLCECDPTHNVLCMLPNMSSTRSDRAPGKVGFCSGLGASEINAFLLGAVEELPGAFTYDMCLQFIED
jgi:hypothetical protein